MCSEGTDEPKKRTPVIGDPDPIEVPTRLGTLYLYEVSIGAISRYAKRADKEPAAAKIRNLLLDIASRKRRDDVTGTRKKLTPDDIAQLDDDEVGLIHYSRGHIIVLDRPKLEKRVCECYGVVKKALDRLLAYELPVQR